MIKRIRLIDDDERAVVGLWRGHLCRGTIEGYIYCVRRFRSYCKRQNIVEAEQLTAARLERFLRADGLTRSRGRRSTQNRRLLANKALHAWACALKTMGRPIPLWREAHEKRPPVPLQEYCQYRRSHNGVSERTLARDVETASAFLRQLRLRKKPIERAALADVDALVRTFSARLSKRTVADNCSSLRAFLRFLHTTGRLPVDLASGVIAPRYRIDERPPRTLPWKEVQAILRSISRSQAPGKRDFAILLLLATYGLGAAEVLALRLEDLDWRARVLRVRRPKTKVLIELPLLPPVARALTAYLRWERPPAKSVPFLFLSKIVPYQPITSGAIRHRIHHYARLAGVSARVIGSHAFRHSHATRQVDSGANIKIVSDILGHGSPSSTSVYVRVALKRLRTVALPVPR